MTIVISYLFRRECWNIILKGRGKAAGEREYAAHHKRAAKVYHGGFQRALHILQQIERRDANNGYYDKRNAKTRAVEAITKCAEKPRERGGQHDYNSHRHNETVAQFKSYAQEIDKV